MISQLLGAFVIFVASVSAIAVGAQTPAPAGTATSQRSTTPAQRSAADAPAGDAANGGKLFVKYGCYECHGREGQGGQAGPRIAPNPPSITTLIRYVRAPRGEMPPYTEKLLSSDQDLIDIHAYLSSRAPAKPQAIPAAQ
jgi:mono/diheme cytochrome c family protein